MTFKKIAVLLSLAVTAGCSTTNVIWPKQADQIDGVYSRQVAFLPYTTQGIDVAPTTNWYYGKTAGIRAYAAEGGIVYVTDAEGSGKGSMGALAKENTLDEEGQETWAVEAAEGASLEKEGLGLNALQSDEAQEAQQAAQEQNTSGVNGYSAKGVNKFSAKDPVYIDKHLVNGAFIGSISFPLNKSDQLYEPSQNHLDQFIESFDASKSMVVLIGYTDDIGLDDYNIPLSEKRAEFVKSKIKEKHNNAEVVVIGSGPSPRLADNRVAGGRETNRRVEIYLINKGEK